MPVFAVPGWVGIVAIVFAVSIAARIGRGGGPRRIKPNKWQFSEDLEQRIAELEESQRQLGSGAGPDVERRLAELEERLDFAERMLAKKNDGERLGPPRA